MKPAFFQMHHRYPIDKTSICFNLTKENQAPKLSRNALMALVEWTVNRSKGIGLNGLGGFATSESFTFDQLTGANCIEENKDGRNTGSIG